MMPKDCVPAKHQPIASLAADATNQRRRMILCADDYGLAPGVSRAIAELIEAGRLSATGCMTVSPFWPEAARRVITLGDRADIGLHLTLTDQAPLGPMPHLAPDGRLPRVGVLLRRAMTGPLDASEIRAEVLRQIDAFETAMGRPPVFVDGHHHVHQFPTIRQVVAEVLAARAAGQGEPRPFVRVGWASPWALARCYLGPKPMAGAFGRALVIARLGRAMERTVKAFDLPHNRGFAGVYDLAPGTVYEPLFARFLAVLPDGGLMMCHPGFVDEALAAADPVTGQREVEQSFLASSRMPEVLAAAGVRLARFGDRP